MGTPHKHSQCDRRAGVRPANGTGSAGQLAATETHLKDMRAIAFQLLAMETKP